MTDRDMQTYRKRQEEFRKMVMDKLGADTRINQFRPTNSYRDFWEIQVEKNGKTTSVKFLAELMTDDGNNYETEFERHLFEIVKSLEG